MSTPVIGTLILMTTLTTPPGWRELPLVVCEIAYHYTETDKGVRCLIFAGEPPAPPTDLPIRWGP